MLFPALSLTLFALGVIALFAGGRRLLAGRLVGAAVRSVAGLAAISAGILSLGVSINLWSYYRLTAEAPVADVSIRQIAEREFALELSPVDGDPRTYQIAGDQWQIDARFIKWTPLFSLLGQSPLFRLERLNGRYGSIQDELSQPRTVHALSSDPGLDLWDLARSGRFPGVDAYYGTAAFVPLVDGALYHVSLGGTGLVVRAGNERASGALARWD